MATYYLDFEGGNDGNDGTTFANRWKTFASGATAARTAPGDTIRIMASPDPSSLGITAQWTNKSSTVTLASALNVLITDCESAWTASTNVTCSTGGTFNQFRTGTTSVKHAIAAGFTTGKAAYFDLGGSNDYSGYEGITLWVMVQTSTLAASTLSIRLCSDTTGDTTVDTLPLPPITLVDCWVPVYIDLGSALGSAIQSIALYADADPGTIDVYFDNINTVKASSGGDNLHLRSLIGKNTGSTEYWWGIRSISGTDVQIDGTPYNFFGTNQRVGRGYSGTTESVTTYHRDPIVLPQTSGNAQVVQESGTSGNHITYSGGWNRSDMSTQTGETWIDGSGAWGIGIHYNGNGFLTIDKLNCVRYDYGHYMACTFTNDVSIGTIRACHCRTGGIYFRDGNFISGTDIVANACVVNFTFFVGLGLVFTKLRSLSAGLPGGAQPGFGLASAGINWMDITTLDIYNAEGRGYVAGGSTDFLNNTHVGTLTIKDCGNVGFEPGPGITDLVVVDTLVSEANGSAGVNFANTNGRLYIKSLTCTNNTGVGVIADSLRGAEVVVGSLTTSGNSQGVSDSQSYGKVTILNSSIAETTKITTGSAGYSLNGRLIMRNFNATANDHRTYFGSSMGEIFSETSVRHTASGLAWRISPKSSFINQYHPVVESLGFVNVNASAAVTLKLWMRRTNTNLVGTFRVRGGQIAGVSTDQTASISAAADTWQELTLTFTPTETGAVEMEVLTYASDGATTYNLYIDDFTPSQA